jgi:DNA-binding transcriptional ArsR family regulator
MDGIVAEVAQESINNQQAGAGSSRLPSLTWEIGTAYEFFISLYVLHHPDEFGLRASWAAGVRSRLDPDARKTLEEAQGVMGVPLGWIYSNTEVRDSASILWTLRQMPPASRLYNLTFCCEEMKASELENILVSVLERKSWNSSDAARVDEILRKEYHKTKTDEIPKLLNIWANSAEFGERFLTALQSYYQVFFAEEEKHLLPQLQAGLQRAQQLAEKLPLPELIERLSRGVVLKDVQKHDGLILVPSFWSTPIIFFDELSDNRMIMAFGTRPEDASLIPGEVVPDALLSILKALADPTRLRILRYMVRESLTAAEISRRLRLRPPTVTHHLSALRLAGLVQLRLEEDERRYTARLEVLEGLTTQILRFIGQHGEEDNTA